MGFSVWMKLSTSCLRYRVEVGEATAAPATALKTKTFFSNMMKSSRMLALFS